MTKGSPTPHEDDREARARAMLDDLKRAGLKMTPQRVGKEERSVQNLALQQIKPEVMKLEAERAELEVTLGELERHRASFVCSDDHPVLVANPPRVTAASSTIDKLALFRRLFVGRPDVFPVRWENRKTGRSGYAPACANEWVKGICGKPQVGYCPIYSSNGQKSMDRVGRRRTRKKP